MSLVEAIFRFLKELLSAIRAYFPPAPTEQKVEDSQKAVVDAIEKEKKSGRPQ